jgi:hypothetical protein
MKVLPITAPILVLLASLTPMKALAQCDEFVGSILSKHLRPEIENVDCAVLKRAGLDKKGHELKSVCYQSSGQNSHIRIDTHLSCQTSPNAVFKPSISENVTVEADVRGSDCHLNYVKVKPSGELGKVLAALFNANGKARKVLEQGLAEVCNR